MDLEYFRNFVTIAESGSLTAAAEKLGIAQPALSIQVKNLEQYYNTKLLIVCRGIRKLKLTDAGKIFYERARSICALELATRMEVNDCTKGLTGTLRISLSPAKVSSFVTNYLQPFHQEHPSVTYQLHEVPVYEQVTHILSGISDFAIANAPLPEPERFDILFAHKERLIVVVNSANPWIKYKNEALSLPELKNIPICINFGCYPLFEKTCLEAGIKPEIMSLCTTKITALQFASLNLGIAVVPTESHETLADNLLKIPINSNKLFLNKMLFKAKGNQLSPIANKFIEFYQSKSNSLGK